MIMLLSAVSLMTLRKKNETHMRKFATVLLAVMMSHLGLIAQQPTYLVNSYKPVDSYRYTAYPYTGSGSKQMALSGGLKWYGGFTIGYSSGPYKPGFATFQLGGKYETLMFVLGHENTGTGAGGTGIDTDPRIVTVYADGRKIMDEVVYPYGIPKRISLNIAGVNELKFILVSGSGQIGFAEATLWKAGQTPVETGNIPGKKPETIELVKDLKPYFQNNRMVNVWPQGKTTQLTINGQHYDYGLSVNMERAIVGNNPGWSYFNLRGQYATLSFVVGPLNSANSGSGTGWITVKADNRILYEQELSYDDIAQTVTLDVSGCQMLSFQSEQSEGSLCAGIANIMLYPEHVAPQAPAGTDATVDPRLKSLPDVCKLISNIPPYTALAQTEKQIYDGSSDYITFSMGGVRYSEGIVFYNKANVLSDDTRSYAVFDLGNEFDYVSFTAGYIGKSGALTNDVLKVYADDKLVLEEPLIATYPNRDFVVPLNKCRKLRFETSGSSTLDVAAYGIADVVVYRGEPVKNDLFVHPRPECPYTIDLIDLGAPYIHYVSPMKQSDTGIFYDGTTRKNYFDLNGQRIYKGFLLQTSVHFSLDYGPLSGTDGAAAGAIGGAAVGSAFVAGGVAVGGAVVGSTLIGAAALLMLAAGGEALESSCAAFNTYGEYNSVTFTVACYKPYIRPDDYKETLLIAADHKVMAQLTVYETMEPQTVTVPIDGCQQLMFWLANTDNWSGQFLFYDIKLSKDHAARNIPKDARLSEAVITAPVWSEKAFKAQWERPKSSGQKEVDRFLTGVSNAYTQVENMMEKAQPEYDIHTYYLETDAGQVCKAVMLQSRRGENLTSIIREYTYCQKQLAALNDLKATLRELTLMQANASLALPELGLSAFAYGKLLSQGGKVVKECNAWVDQMYEEKLAETRFLESVVNGAIDIDGKQSTETTILCPLLKGETPPTDELQLVRNFVIK